MERAGYSATQNGFCPPPFHSPEGSLISPLSFREYLGPGCPWALPQAPQAPQSFLARILQGHPNLWTGFQGQRPQGASLAFQLKVSDSRRERGQEKEGPTKGEGTEGTQADPGCCGVAGSSLDGRHQQHFLPWAPAPPCCPQYWAWDFQPSFLGSGRNETFSRRPLLA